MTATNRPDFTYCNDYCETSTAPADDDKAASQQFADCGLDCLRFETRCQGKAKRAQCCTITIEEPSEDVDRCR